MRCLQCKNAPCVAGCPVGIRIPDFLKAAAAGRFDEAVAIIRENSLLPAVCGRVCPQEVQCQAPCTLGKALKDVDKAVSIGRVERFVSDLERESGRQAAPEIKPATGKKVAVIGSGPASITVAADVRREGHEVTMFEAFHKPGGVLIYGIPEFRLPKAIVQNEIDLLQRMGVKLELNYVVGRTRKIKDMLAQDGFDALFVGTGYQWDRVMRRQQDFDASLFGSLLPADVWERVPSDRVQRLLEAAPCFRPPPAH